LNAFAGLLYAEIDAPTQEGYHAGASDKSQSFDIAPVVYCLTWGFKNEPVISILFIGGFYKFERRIFSYWNLYTQQFLIVKYLSKRQNSR